MNLQNTAVLNAAAKKSPCHLEAINNVIYSMYT